MTPKQIEKLKISLASQRGVKHRLSIGLNVDPSKITKALDGLVRDKDFMIKLKDQAQIILQERKSKESLIS